MKAAEDVTVFSMIATPFKVDGSLDLDSYAELVDQMCAANVGIYLASGGAGEGHSLSIEETRELYRVGVEVCAGRVPLAANPREPRTAIQMLELATTAAEAGVPLVQFYALDPGHGMLPTDLELERYYRFLLDRFDHPVALSVHGLCPYPISSDFLYNLAASYTQIQAINLALMPMNFFTDVQRKLDGLSRHVQLYTALPHAIEALYADGSGFLAAEPNIIPFTMRRLVDAVISGDIETAGELYKFIYGVANVVNRWAPSTARWLKMAMRVLEIPGGNGVMREPYTLPGEQHIEAMRKEFARLSVAEVESESVELAGRKGVDNE